MARLPLQLAVLQRHLLVGGGVRRYGVLGVVAMLGACSWFTDFKEQPKIDPWESASDTVPFRGNPQYSVSVYGSAAYTDGRYVSFTDAPPPLELTGGPQVVDISGSVLPGISKWAFSWGGEYAQPKTILGRAGQVFGAVDASYRSDFSSSATPSRYLNVDAYKLVNARIGFRADGGWDAFLWARNLLDEDYFEQLAAAPGGSGLYAAQVGDPRTTGVTLRWRF